MTAECEYKKGKNAFDSAKVSKGIWNRSNAFWLLNVQHIMSEEWLSMCRLLTF